MGGNLRMNSDQIIKELNRFDKGIIDDLTNKIWYAKSVPEGKTTPRTKAENPKKMQIPSRQSF